MLQENEEANESTLKVLGYELAIGNQWFSYWTKGTEVLKLNEKTCRVDKIWENVFLKLDYKPN